MATLPGRLDCCWTATAPRTSYPALSGSGGADVAVIGAGIVGLTAAYLLAKCWPLGCRRRGTPHRTAGDGALHRQYYQSALAHLSSFDRDARHRSGAILCRGEPERCAPDLRLGRRTWHRL